jgi:predicted dehydrogenase|tara:strand:- start:1793 stop:2752 length:960 start_codon:yes stop_codon:yes gene_type:complete
MKLGIIGCGKIASYHIISMRKAGFKLHSISGTNNSKNAKKFKKKYNITKVFKNTKNLIESKEYDALLLLTPPEVTYRYLSMIKSSVKVLAEKPITFYSSKLKTLKAKENIKIAFNRRQYKGVNQIKSKVDKNDIYLIEISIPESINSIQSKNSRNFRKKYFNIFYNSIHLFDLIKYLVGNYTVSSIKHIKDKSNNLKGYVINVKSKKVKNIIIKSIFNSSDNFSLNAYSSKARYEMCPIEAFSKYEGTKVIEPTSKYPLRRYVPIVIQNSFESMPKNFKPGFDSQARAFFNFCNKKKTNLASINDMLDSISLAERIFEF